MGFCWGTWRIAIVVTLVAAADAHAALPRHPCPDIIEGKDVRMKRNLHLNMPAPGRSSFADVHTAVICSIARGGFLKACTSLLTDPRGPALSKQVSRWRVLSASVHGCSVRGRKIRFGFQLRYTD